MYVFFQGLGQMSVYLSLDTEFRGIETHACVYWRGFSGTGRMETQMRVSWETTLRVKGYENPSECRFTCF